MHTLEYLILTGVLAAIFYTLEDVETLIFHLFPKTWDWYTKHNSVSTFISSYWRSIVAVAILSFLGWITSKGW